MTFFRPYKQIATISKGFCIDSIHLDEINI